MKYLIMLGMVEVLGAGPVGEYLGLIKGKTWVYIGTEKDSTLDHPSITGNFQDTVKIVDEFAYDGAPAYLRRTIHISDIRGMSTGIDTLWEEGNSLLGRWIYDRDTAVPYTLYKTPFEIDTSWRTVWENLSCIDLDGDGIKDTIKIAKDSACVITKENVSVPYGDIRDAYKIKKEGMWEAWLSFSPSPQGVIQTFKYIDFQWYAPHTGLVKDTGYAEVFYYDMRGSLMEASFMWTHKVLVQVEGIEEKKSRSSSFKIKSPFFSKELSLSFFIDRPSVVKLYLYDITGREKGKADYLCSPGKHTLKYTPEELHCGVYFLRICRDGRDIGVEKVIKMK